MKFTKFLVVGMFCFSASLSVNAHEVNNDINSFTTSYDKILMKKFHDEAIDIIHKYTPENIVNKNLKLNIKLLPSLATLEKKIFSQKFGAKNTSSEFSFLSKDNEKKYSYFSLQKNSCSIQMAIEDDGVIPTLSPGIGVELLSDTNLQNDNQRKIAREFLALHESFHCSFVSFDNPIKVASVQDQDLMKQINYLLQDQSKSYEIPYINVLNENFADTAAALSLIKEYGHNNKDLQFVMQSWITQRHAAYFQNYYGEHATHFSLNYIFKNGIDKKVSKYNSNDIMEKALEIANDGTAQAFVHKNYMLRSALHFHNITKPIYDKLYILIKNKYTNEVIPPESFNMRQKGFASDMARNVISNFDHTSIEIYKSDGTPGKDFSYLDQTIKILIKNYQFTEKDLTLISDSPKQLEKFSYLLKKDESPFDYVNGKLAPEHIYRKVKLISAKFAENNKDKLKIK